jgi:hypothetical protein
LRSCNLRNISGFFEIYESQSELAKAGDKHADDKLLAEMEARRSRDAQREFDERQKRLQSNYAARAMLGSIFQLTFVPFQLPLLRCRDCFLFLHSIVLDRKTNRGARIREAKGIRRVSCPKRGGGQSRSADARGTYHAHIVGILFLSISQVIFSSLRA